MTRTLLALGIVLAGLTIGIAAEVAARNADERLLEPGVLVAGALIVSGVIAAAAYWLWPR